jgi:hypothetical protein
MWLIVCCAYGQSFFVFVLYGMRRDVYTQWRDAFSTRFKSVRGSSTVTSGKTASSHRRNNSSAVKEVSVHEVELAGQLQDVDLEQSSSDDCNMVSTASERARSKPEAKLVTGSTDRSDQKRTPFN